MVYVTQALEDDGAMNTVALAMLYSLGDLEDKSLAVSINPTQDTVHAQSNTLATITWGQSFWRNHGQDVLREFIAHLEFYKIKVNTTPIQQAQAAPTTPIYIYTL